VRQHGPDAFERCVAEAVPLSRQIAEAASDGCNMDDAEGRARMLANAKPLWAALPEGALRLQVLSDLAARGRIETGELLSLWGAASTARGAASAANRKPGPRRAGRVSLGTANLLDRALWLVLQRSELWASLDNEAHDLLAGQPAPYDIFFACVDRTVMEHGPLTPAALMLELRAAAEREADDSLALARIARFHEPEAQTDIAVELARTLDGLRLQAVGEELQLIFESGVQSPDAQVRCKQLMETRARLKGRL
jgi:DNA primase